MSSTLNDSEKDEVSHLCLMRHKKIGTQKRVILTLQAKILKVKNDFETLKSEHASLVNEHIASPSIETPKVDLPKVPTCMDLGICESCLKLHEEIDRIFQEKISRKK